ncbi:radical SAM domain protein [Candidatus Nitrosopumilus salaria BD31]|uniref:Radical SAM domain protein n=1 Tax=Candidatus Nitrosopumilus salarius BD31 TaxID=859350 RepID=I3D5F2_9ARCH|nr:radical SAM protein [Candidatus Nitrosopumilus salaria]EIJ66945.1 radical SAM domain protein [Candidatus Nitrosopumilus salaria BD31]
MKVLFVVPEIRLDSAPNHFPFWAGILAAIVEQKGGQVGILDLNALRDNYDGRAVPVKKIVEEISSEKWDMIGIGGLTTTYARIKQLSKIIRKCSPNSLYVGGGGWSTYNPTEILQLIPELNLIVIGEGEETFSELYDELETGSNDFEKINGLCYRDNNNEIKFTGPRALISDLNTVPYPAYDLMETEIYFKYSSFSLSAASFNSKRRASTVWERGCPRGCTFCSHNGMSRIDLQNIYGEGDRKEGEKLVRISDKENDTFQLPARWPTPEYAVNNVKLLVEKFNVDFVSILDENMTSNLKWTKEFCDLYVSEGLDKDVKWGTLGDAPSVAVKPEIVQTMKDAGCEYISFGFESASDKVLNQDIQKGQLRKHLQITVDTIKRAKMTPITTFMIGNAHENIDDLMETVDFWIQNNAEIDPFICTPYVGSPIFYDNQDYLLQQYDSKLKMISDKGLKISDDVLKKWKLDALDKFMTECGDATKYTATVSQYFTIAELFALKEFMYKHDTRRMLQMAHQKFDETGLPQWRHNEKWEKYCEVCKSKKELEKTMNCVISNEIGAN